MNSKKKPFVHPIKIEVTRKARTETILGKAPAIFNGPQPPQADDPYMRLRLVAILISARVGLRGPPFWELGLSPLEFPDFYRFNLTPLFSN